MTCLLLNIEGNALELAARLVGSCLLVDGVGGMIVETEAYRRDDPASHSFKGLTRSNASMFGPPGRAYVYRSYGLHWCLNVVAEDGGAVLIRAMEPEFGIEIMQARRGISRDLCSGPGRLTQALAVTGMHDGRSFKAPPFDLLSHRSGSVELMRGPRIGISKSMHQPWRFGLAGSIHVSKPFR